MTSDKRARWEQQQRGLISERARRYAIECGKFFIQLAFNIVAGQRERDLRSGTLRKQGRK